jgi:hypothetical protein
MMLWVLMVVVLLCSSLLTHEGDKVRKVLMVRVVAILMVLVVLLASIV